MPSPILIPLTHSLLAVAVMLPASFAQEVEDDPPEIEARKYTSARDKREIIGIALTPYLSMGIQAEAEASYERQGSSSDSRITFEELSIGFEGTAGDYLSGIVLFKGEFGTDTEYLVEEAYVRLGGTDTFPWFAQGGRMELPFGEFESHFVQDTLVQIIGETEGDGATAGYEGEVLEVSATLFQGDLYDEDVDNWILVAKCDPTEEIECGLSLISDIAESVELKELQREDQRERDEKTEDVDEEPEEEIQAPGPSHAPSIEDIAGLGVFVIFEWDTVFVDAEVVAALESFAAGRLDDRRRKPVAWHLEAGVRPISRWEVAVRVEYADELPGFPDVQYGIATSFGITSQLTISADFVHGEFRGPEHDLDLAGAALTFEF